MKKHSFFVTAKLCLVVSLFLLGIVTGKAQFNTYHPFPDSNAGWSETLTAQDYGTCDSGGLGGERYQIYSYYAGGDTIVNGKKYSKLYCSGGISGTTTACRDQEDTVCYNYLHCLIRNDTTARKVYASFDYGKTDTLLYDFSLQVGDTLPDSYNNLKIRENYISSIDSILIGINFRKRFWISNRFFTNLDYIIEGIGSQKMDISFAPCSKNDKKWTH